MHQGTFQDINGFGASPDGIGATPVPSQHPPLPPLSAFGAEDGSIPIAPAPSRYSLNRTFLTVYSLASIAGAGLGAYHGYKRNDSWGWALGWAALGSLFPVVTIPVSFAQGFGKRKGR